jgi:hypothetical protein
MASTRATVPSGRSSTSGAWAAMARGRALRSGSPADPPGQGDNQHAVEHHEHGEGGHRHPPRTHEVEVGVTRAKRFKARAGDDQEQGTVGEATGSAGGQPTAQQQVGGPRGQAKEQASEDDEPQRAVDADAPHQLLGFGDPPLGTGAGGDR